MLTAGQIDTGLPALHAPSPLNPNIRDTGLTISHLMLDLCPVEISRDTRNGK